MEGSIDATIIYGNLINFVLWLQTSYKVELTALMQANNWELLISCNLFPS